MNNLTNRPTGEMTMPRREMAPATVEQLRGVIADLFCADTHGKFMHQSVQLELTGATIAFAMAHHLESALIQSAGTDKADATIIMFYNAMLHNGALSPLGTDTLNSLFSIIVDGNLESILSGELLSPVQH